MSLNLGGLFSITDKQFSITQASITSEGKLIYHRKMQENKLIN